MTPHATPFLGLEPTLCDPATARVVVVPFGYEGGVSYGRGTAAALKRPTSPNALGPGDRGS